MIEEANIFYADQSVIDKWDAEGSYCGLLPGWYWQTKTGNYQYAPEGDFDSMQEALRHLADTIDEFLEG